MNTLGVVIAYLRLEYLDIFALAQCNLINIDSADIDTFYGVCDFHAKSITQL